MTTVTDHNTHTLSHYSVEQKQAIMRLYDCVRHHPGTSGSRYCAGLLLGLYNGTRFPYDLTNLRGLDDGLFAAHMTVLQMDARQTWCEVHVLLDAIHVDGKCTGTEFAHWAHNLRLKGRCKKENLPEPERIR